MLLLAVLLGLCIGWVDPRPTWDDAGITVGMILVISVGMILVISVGMILVISALSLIPAFLGAYAGALFTRIL
jgi:hypothetical protein